MQDLNEVHGRIKQKKDEKKKVNEIYRDALLQSKPYQDLLDEVKELRTKKLRMESEIRSGFTQEIEKMERLALDIKNDVELLSDMALSLVMKGETVEVTDEYDVKYEPVFKVSFKKAG
ncbi:hypothetical protein KBC59_02505 [Patescibacteria group bacterium]|jgi:hypothetical protein|nr:hypothetical protein [Patescibacteria group bacterium]